MDSKHVKATVTWRKDLTEELWLWRIRPEERVPFQPGQYITLGLPGSEKLIERPYSVVSSPLEPELEFFLELVSHGELTPMLHKLRVGHEVSVRRIAKGRFLFDAASGHPNHFLVATVTGVAPYISMVRNFAARADAGEKIPYRLALLQSASFSNEFGYREELTALAEKHKWLTYVPSVSRAWLDPGWTSERGRAEDIVRKHLDGLGFTAADTTAYACGNPDMIVNVKGVLKRVGFAPEAVKEEIYWIPEKAGPGT